MRTTIVLFLFMTACGSGTKPHTTTPANPDANAKPTSQGPVGMRGTLNGMAVDKLKLVVVAQRCVEKDLKAIRVAVGYLTSTSEDAEPIPLFDVSFEPARMPALHEKFTPTLRAEERSGVAAQIMTYGASRKELPRDAWIIVDRGDPEGPIDISLWADFGEQGTIEGRLTATTTQEIVCRSPATPPSAP
jgi:hypothetical protein